MQGKRILIIDDDPQIRRITELAFVGSGATVFTAASPREGLRQLYARQPHLVLLDILMPEQDGWETCRQIRQLSDVPVIMLTALKQDEDIVHGLECGADDFVSKPFNPQVLLARARAVLRRTELTPQTDLPAGYSDDHLNIDLDRRKVWVEGRTVNLTPTEFRLLAYLIQNAGRVLTFNQILENVWGQEYRDNDDYVHVYISHLRQKLEQDAKQPRYLVTEHGVGYRFERYAA